MNKKNLRLGISCVIAVLFGLLSGFNKATARHFVKNVGQVTDQHFNHRSDIDFKLKGGNGLHVFIGSGRVHYQWLKATDTFLPAEMYRMDVELLGANPNAKIITEGQNTTYERYYTNGLEGAIAHQYSKITYKDIYPNIDQVFYFTKDGLLEYDFVIHPRGKVSDIRIKYSGADDLKLNTNGSLTAVTPMGVVTENTPIAYQQKDKAPVSSTFRLDGNILSFSAASYSGTLVIDPVLEWATYYGGSEWDAINAMAYGKDGYIYTVGNTNSASNIATVGAYLTTFQGGSNTSGADAFLTKFDTNGDLVWATYYGGSNVDQGSGIATDTSGHVYIAGRTSSTMGIATTGVHQDTKAGTAASFDAYIAKFDTAGAREWGSYYGGTGAEGSETIVLTCDNQNNLYLAGNTASTAGIATTGAHQTTRSGSGDAFLAKFTTAGLLDWGTYFGGTATDFINAVTTDVDGNIYITGHTNSNDGVATTGTHQIANAGSTDAFVAKFNPSGQQLYGSYFGGTSLDQATGMAVDTSGYVYMTGVTASSTGISTMGVHQATHGGGSLDVFLSKFDLNGNIIWSSYYGGNGTDAAPSVSFGSDGIIYLSGRTNSIDNIATIDAIVPAYTNQNSELEILLASFDTAGQRIWSTYLGGSLSEWNTDLVIDEDGKVFLSGYTGSTDFATTGAYQNVFGGNRDGYFLKVNMCFLPQTPDTIIGALEICSNTPVTYHVEVVNGAAAYEWILPSGWSGSSSTDSITITADVSGTIMVAAVSDCGHSDTIQLDITVLPSPEPIISRNGNILSVTQAFSSYQWNRNGQAISGASLATYAVTENGSYTVTVTAANGCEGTSGIEEITHLSVDRLDATLFTIHPNPAKDVVTVNIESEAVMELYDVTGRSLMTAKLSNGVNKLDISHLQNGMYIIHVSSNDGGYIGKAKLVKASV